MRVIALRNLRPDDADELLLPRASTRPSDRVLDETVRSSAGAVPVRRPDLAAPRAGRRRLGVGCWTRPTSSGPCSTASPKRSLRIAPRRARGVRACPVHHRGAPPGRGRRRPRGGYCSSGSGASRSSTHHATGCFPTTWLARCSTAISGGGTRPATTNSTAVCAATSSSGCDHRRRATAMSGNRPRLPPPVEPDDAAVLGFDGLAQGYLDRLRPDDQRALRAMVTTHEGPESVASSTTGSSGSRRVSRCSDSAPTRSLEGSRR